jgi:uncharacterized protein (DUF1015 family)
MAEIRPFRALRYDTSRVRLEDVVTQPYDKISPAMQRGYYERHAANFVRFELPVADAHADVYQGAREFLGQLRRDGLVRLEDRPALYVYEQEFDHPTQPQTRLRRQALIGLGRLHEYDDGVVFRHEQTLTGPKKDREELLKTARTQSGLLFLLYDDRKSTVASMLSEIVQRPADVGFTDDLNIAQRLWVVSDPESVAAIQAAFTHKRLFIADGHHRYETALALRRSREGKYGEDFAMMALVRLDDPGLLVLPTHRAVFGLAPEKVTDTIAWLKRELGMKKQSPEDVGEWRSSRFSTAVITPDDTFSVDCDRALLQSKFPQGATELDVEALHLIFSEVLGITAEDVAAQRNVRYHRRMEEAVRDVHEGGAQMAFLLHAVPVDVIRDRSLRGALMPQKSTDFYPKMNSGLTLYSWDESFAAPSRGASL